MMKGWWRDVRYAARSFRRAPAFSAVAMGTLALAMAAAIAIFSLVNGVLMRPLAYPAADRLVHLEGSEAGRYGVAMPDVIDVRTRSRTLESVVAYQGWSYLARDPEGVLVRRRAASVSSNFFELLGTRPVLGRFFLGSEDVAGHAPVLVIGEDLWRRELGGRNDVIGRTVPVSGTSYTIIGVAPASLVDPLARALGWSQPEVWRVHPAEFDSAAALRGWIGFWSVARLRPGSSAEAAEREVQAILRDAYPEQGPEPVVRVSTFRDSLVRSIRPTLLALFASVIGVLLIGCANVANLLLSRSALRVRELAVRASLGGTRARLVRQLFIESLALAAAAAMAGLLLAHWTLRVLGRVLASQLPEETVLAMDVRVASFAALLAVATALLFGLAPALQLTRSEGMATLREGGRGQIGGRHAARVRHALVVAETALAVVLLAGAGLFFRTFLNLQRIDTGFAAESVLTASLNLFPEQFPTPELQTLALASVQEGLRTRASVQSVAAISDLPMSGAINSTGITPPAGGESVQTLVRTIAGDYFGTLHIPLRAGRSFDAGDHTGATQVAIINRTAAERYFGEGDPLGRTLTVRGVGRTVVGVVEDVTEFSVSDERKAVLYTPYAQETQAWMRSTMQLVARGGPPQQVAAAIRAAARAERTSTSEPRPLQELVARDIAAPRIRATLFALFAALALALAAVGIGGVIAYGVSARLPELGVRLALGASPATLVRLVVAQSARLALTGAALGVLATYTLARLVTGLLYGVPATDPLTLAAAAAVLVTVGLLAAAVPALRAGRVDPAITLRAD